MTFLQLSDAIARNVLMLSSESRRAEILLVCGDMYTGRVRVERTCFPYSS